MPRKKDEFMLDDERALREEIEGILNPRSSPKTETTGSGQVAQLDLSDVDLKDGSDPELHTDLDIGLGSFVPK